MSRSTISDRRYRTFTLILKLREKLALNIQFSTAHMGNGAMKFHGPQTWPWWRLVAPRMLKLFQSRDPDVVPAWPLSTGKRLWLYTRWGAYYFDFVLDRRGVVKKRIQGWTNSWT